MFACTRRFGEAGIGRSAIHIHSVGGFEKGFVVNVCRACENPPCQKVCPTGALTKRQGGGVVHLPSKCISCGNCLKACTLGAIHWDKTTSKPSFCVYDGYCSKFCPYGVLKLEEIGESNLD
jgi:Fe-S-cluster-containing dehydrogenase component